MNIRQEEQMRLNQVAMEKQAAATAAAADKKAERKYREGHQEFL